MTVRYEDDAPAGGGQARGGRDPPQRRARSRDAGPRPAGARDRRRRRPTRRASCTGWTATPRACWWWPAPTGSTGASRDAPRARRSSATTWPSVHGTHAAGADRRPPDRPRPAQPHAQAIDDAEGREARHPLRRLEDLGRFAFAGRAPRDRPHPPDPRPPGARSASGGRRPRLRAPRRRRWGWSGSSCTPRGSRSRTRRPASRS